MRLRGGGQDFNYVTDFHIPFLKNLSALLESKNEEKNMEILLESHPGDKLQPVAKAFREQINLFVDIQQYHQH